jgi:glycosyltransferase involved in cell wall biosynthesis
VIEKDEKDNVILSVGRFAIAGEGHNKRQLEMLSAFRSISDTELKNWEYYSVGQLGSSPKHREFFSEVSRSAAESHAHVLANLMRTEIKRLFARAKIFWHAAGYGENEETNPQLAEHFGIVTVEAMAAGCVPVVVNLGGQREIVEHGVNGYLWDDFDQLKMYTLRLARDESLRIRMSEAARQRARTFGPEVFQQKYLNLVETLVR